MSSAIVLALALWVLCTSAGTLPLSTTPSPTVLIDLATVHGVSDGYTKSFLGIPYAEPPVGNLRLNVPNPIKSYTGTINATYFGNLCYNFVAPATRPTWITPAQLDYFAIFNETPPAPFSEDCLNLNVIAPAHVKPGKLLPVVAYIFFGAFEFGGAYDVDGRIMVKRSVELGEPVIFVSMNHRVLFDPTVLDDISQLNAALGFLGGKDVKNAKVGNLGLQDQRVALHWIQKYITQFGGDPRQVTLLGLSSGGVSSGLHLVYGDGVDEGLFRGLWAESGAVQPLGPTDSATEQMTYDNYVSALNCSNATDTLECVRKAPLEAVTNVTAISQVMWTPTVDGVTLVDLPQKLLSQGKHVRVPAVAGNAEDEGTLFAINAVDMHNSTEFMEFVKYSYYNSLSDAEAQTLLQLYPNDPAQGAPYGTGDNFEYTQMHKRVASLQGDVAVDSVRRFFSQQLSPRQDVWAYLYRRNRVPGWGSTHASEIADMYEGGDLGDLFIHFANTLDPNGAANVSQNWPKYDNDNPVLLDFSRNTSLGLTNDTYREDPIKFLINLNLNIPWPI